MRKEWFFCLSLPVTSAPVTFEKEQKFQASMFEEELKKPEYFYISILTSVSLAAFNPTIRAFRSEISKHVPAKPKFFGMFKNGLKRVILNKCTFLKPHYSYSVILN